jgi:sugar (pentulose or hexulose) kinase
VAVNTCLENVGVKIQVVAVTHQRESFACLDAQAKPLRPAMLWLERKPHPRFLQTAVDA